MLRSMFDDQFWPIIIRLHNRTSRLSDLALFPRLFHDVTNDEVTRVNLFS